MKSKFYYSGAYLEIAENIKDYINSSPDFLSEHTTTPRSAGDALENLISEKFDDFLGDWSTEYHKEFTRRAMEDLAFEDTQGIYSAVDVKTHMTDTSFNMPNLISVERLAKFYESDNNVFSILMIKYAIEGTKLTATEVIFSPIEFFDWKCLTIGALGWGQIQIASSDAIQLRDKYSRKSWMLELCEVMSQFYPKEIVKIGERINHFETIRQQWENKDDIWS